MNFDLKILPRAKMVDFYTVIGGVFLKTFFYFDFLSKHEDRGKTYFFFSEYQEEEDANVIVFEAVADENKVVFRFGYNLETEFEIKGAYDIITAIDSLSKIYEELKNER